MANRLLELSNKLGDTLATGAEKFGRFVDPVGRSGREVVPAVQEIGSAIGSSSQAKLGLESQQRNERLQQNIGQALQGGRITQEIADRLTKMLPKVQRPEILNKVQKEGNLGFVSKRLGTAAAFTGAVAGGVSAAQQLPQVIRSFQNFFRPEFFAHSKTDVSQQINRLLTGSADKKTAIGNQFLKLDASKFNSIDDFSKEAIRILDNSGLKGQQLLQAKQAVINNVNQLVNRISNPEMLDTLFKNKMIRNPEKFANVISQQTQTGQFTAQNQAFLNKQQQVQSFVGNQAKPNTAAQSIIQQNKQKAVESLVSQNNLFAPTKATPGLKQSFVNNQIDIFNNITSKQDQQLLQSMIKDLGGLEKASKSATFQKFMEEWVIRIMRGANISVK